MTNDDSEKIADDDVSLLRRRIEEYEARMSETRELISHARHEINNPLTALLGQTQLLMREDLSERARERVRMIEALTMRIRDLTALLRD